MFPSDFLTASQKLIHVYEAFCIPVCQKYHLNQSDLDLLLFLANNPSYNTAKDVCEIRGIKKGIISVTTERLVQSGYLTREQDKTDRRVQRLYLTKNCNAIITDGKAMQEQFALCITSELTKEEFLFYEKISQKIRQQIEKMEKEI